MRTIEIEDDVYEYLLQNTTQIGESASKILRRLLDISGNVPYPDDKIPDTDLSECLSDPNFITKRTVVDKFLFILSYAQKRDPEQFKKIPAAIFGRRGGRKYFALNSKDLEDSGNSVNPQQIPDSPYWVITTTDTPKKRRMLQETLKFLGYGDNAVKQAVAALT